MLKSLKKKYEDLTEPKSPSIFLVATGGMVVGLAGYILLNNLRDAARAGEVAYSLLAKGFHDFDAGDDIFRLTLVKK
jgi:hypothetical protein